MPITYIPEGCYTDANGYKRLMWDEGDGQGVHNNKWFFSFPDSENEAKIAEWHLHQDYGGIEKMRFEADANQQLIIDTVLWIRQRPNLTLAQWNNYLNGKLWYESNCIKAWVFRLAVGLAEHYGLVLANYTETEVLLKVRNWLCNSPLALVARVCFGLYNI